MAVSIQPKGTHFARLRGALVTQEETRKGCPLWVISRHNDKSALCPLYPPDVMTEQSEHDAIRKLRWHFKRSDSAAKTPAHEAEGKAA